MSASLQHMGRTHVALFLAMAGAIFADGAAAQHIYWSDSAGIHRAKADGTDAWTLVLDAGAYRLALDVGRGHIYWSIPGCGGWCEWTPGEIHRASLDGSAARTLIVDDEFEVWDFAFDPLMMKLYWGGVNLGDFIYDGSLSSANYDGSGVGRILRGLYDAGTEAIAVDPVDQVLYWVNYTGLVYAPVNDPSAYAPVGSVTRWAFDLLVDADARLLYWSEVDRIMRSGLDGSGAEAVVVTDAAHAGAIALDPIGRKVYWRTAGSGNADSIRRANLDGTGAEIVLTAPYIRGLAVDPRRDGDFNMDGLVDLRDHVSFAECLGGPGTPPKLPQCAFFDLDPSDGDVDLADHAGFQNAMTEPL